MCGIAGSIVVNAGRINVCSITGQMQARLRHRGPNDHGLVVLNNDRCALAHTRLSILDLSPAGHQPMSTPDGRYWITYNGEIYNYVDLRKELDGDRLPFSASHERLVTNQHWHSNSDTEVILHAHARWGLDFLPKLRGMFAFAIWDRLKEELIIARDSLGIKPLYYYQTNDFFIFASELRALLASGLVPRRLSQDGLESYLQFGSVQDPLTIVAGVHCVLPGQCLVVQCKSGSLKVASDTHAKTTNAIPRPADRSEAVTALRSVLEKSVRQHLISDVSVGAFLSGGVDSSAIVALMSQVTNHRLNTFSVVFKESEFSEAPQARLVAQRFGTEHKEIMLSEKDLLELLPSAFAAMDQPTIDGINTYVVSKAVKESGITVVLSGLGGDELFAGYPSFRRAQQLHRLAITPSAIRRFASLAGRSLFNGSVRRRKFWDMVESDCSPYAAYSLSRQLFSPSEISALMVAGVTDKRLAVEGSTPQASRLTPSGFSLTHNPQNLTPESDVLNTISHYELCGYMANTLLRDTDQMSMAHALEVRVPFVDSVVVDYVLGLPGEWKVDGSRPKPLLVDALGDLLPEEIWKRRKMGFTLPFQKWMRSSLEPELDKIFSDKYRTTCLGVDAERQRHAWDAFKSNPGQQPWSRPWALYVLAKWCELNRVAI
jgi:asparagine synthase (glutamine-hydrolysing)